MRHLLTLFCLLCTFATMLPGQEPGPDAGAGGAALEALLQLRAPLHYSQEHGYLYRAEVLELASPDAEQVPALGQSIWLLHSNDLYVGQMSQPLLRLRMLIEPVSVSDGLWRVSQQNAAGQDALPDLFADVAERFERSLAEGLLLGQAPVQPPRLRRMVSAVVLGRRDTQVLIEYLGPLQEGSVEWQQAASEQWQLGRIQAVDGRFAILHSAEIQYLLPGRPLRMRQYEEQQ